MFFSNRMAWVRSDIVRSPAIRSRRCAGCEQKQTSANECQWSVKQMWLFQEIKRKAKSKHRPTKRAAALSRIGLFRMDCFSGENSESSCTRRRRTHADASRAGSPHHTALRLRYHSRQHIAVLAGLLSDQDTQNGYKSETRFRSDLTQSILRDNGSSVWTHTSSALNYLISSLAPTLSIFLSPLALSLSLILTLILTLFFPRSHHSLTHSLTCIHAHILSHSLSLSLTRSYSFTPRTSPFSTSTTFDNPRIPAKRHDAIQHDLTQIPSSCDRLTSTRFT